MKVVVDYGELYPFTWVDRRDECTGVGGAWSPEWFDANAIDLLAQVVADFEAAVTAMWAAKAAIDAAVRAARGLPPS